MTTPYLPQTMSDVLVDLSHWEAQVDFVQAKTAGIAAVILKATQGTGFLDPPSPRGPWQHMPQDS